MQTFKDDVIATTVARYLSEALEKNTTLIQVNLIINFSGDVLQYFSKVVENNKVLQDLSLGINCAKGNDVIKNFSEALEKNKTLNRLGFAYPMKDDDFLYFCKALEKNTTLKLLSLTGFDLPSLKFTEIEYLAQAIEKNTTLETLEVGNSYNNHLQHDRAAIYRLMEALEKNKTLSFFTSPYVEELQKYRSPRIHIFSPMLLQASIFDTQAQQPALGVLPPITGHSTRQSILLHNAPTAEVQDAQTTRATTYPTQSLMPLTPVPENRLTQPVTELLAVLRPPELLSAEELRQLQQVFTAHPGSHSSGTTYASQQFSSSNAIAVRLSPEEQTRLITMLRRYAYSQIFENYLDQIHQDSLLANYFREMQLYLDNTILAFKAIASGSVEGINACKQLIKFAEKATGGLLSAVSAPIGAGMVTSILSLVLGTINEHNIQTLAYRVARLFPNSSENGAILEALTLLLTIHQSTLIHHPPSLVSINSIYRTYLTWMAKFHGRDNFTAMDYLVMQQAETIVKFWNGLTGEPAPSIERWLPQLLAQFSITLPPDIKPERIGKPLMSSANTIQVQHPILTATSVTVQTQGAPAPDERIAIETMQTEMTQLRQEIQTASQGSITTSQLNAFRNQLNEVAQKIEGLEKSQSSQELGHLKHQMGQMANTLHKVVSTLYPDSSSSQGGLLLVSESPMVANLRLQAENRQLREELETHREHLMRVDAKLEDLQNQSDYLQSRPKQPSSKSSECILL